ncbi:hypothetical protein B7463_g1987, partial [Scytalidium lignicola]
MSPTPVIGLLGGGQLGRMLCEAAAPLEIEIAILDADDAPAKQISQSKYHINGSYKDAEKIRELATQCKIISVETEHIDTTVLEEIASSTQVAVHPSWRTLRLIQDKYEQKAYLSRQGIPIAEQLAVETSGSGMYASLQDISAKFGYPWMLKSKKNSYDGRGNLKISNEADLDWAVTEFGDFPCYAEKYVPFERELSVLVIRTEDHEGRTKRLVPYPAVEMVHEDSVCSRVYMPPRAVPTSMCKQVQQVACSVVDKLWGRGVFAVETFITKDNEILVNEIAPRPHNSGHLFTEAVPYMSQFKAQLTSILDDPLPEELKPHVSSSIMINILGGANLDSHLRLIDKAKSMYGNQIGVYLHLYGKEPKPGRKIGHITITGLTADVTELEEYAQPLIEIANEIRHDRIQTRHKPLRPEQAINKPPTMPLVLVTMGSDSDLPVLKGGLDMAKVATQAASRGIKVIIAAAGGAAHLPGMLAAYTSLPVIGVPVKATHMDGLDSMLSIVQMPRGVPVATVGINNSVNAALLAIRCLGAFIPTFHEKMKAYQKQMEKQVEDKASLLKEIDVETYLAKMKGI